MLKEDRARISSQYVDLVARALIEPNLYLKWPHKEIRLSVTNGGDGSGKAYLNPAPHCREERGRVDDSNCVKCLGVVCSSEFGGLLEMPAEGPHHAKRDTVEVDDRRRRSDRR